MKWNLPIQNKVTNIIHDVNKIQLISEYIWIGNLPFYSVMWSWSFTHS